MVLLLHDVAFWDYDLTPDEDGLFDAGDDCFGYLRANANATIVDGRHGTYSTEWDYQILCALKR